jgi:transcriptional regulator with XRE-family HTH domain
MKNGVELVEILDNYLKSKNISRRQFSTLVDIPNSTIATWKSKNILPSVDLLAKIAKFMNVSLDWLVYGELFENANEQNTYENPCSRKNILYRIEIVLRQTTNDYDYDFKSQHEKYLSDIIDFETLINWGEYKTDIPESTLQKISAKLKVPLQWLLTKDEYHHEDDINAYGWVFGLAKAYPGLLKGYDCLEEEDQKFIDNYIASKLELRQLKREKELKNQ